MGHEDQFPDPKLSGRYRFSYGTFGRTRGNGRDAPKSSHPATSWSAAQVRPYWVIRTKRSMRSPPIVKGAPNRRGPVGVIMSLLRPTGEGGHIRQAGVNSGTTSEDANAKDEIHGPSATPDCRREASCYRSDEGLGLIRQNSPTSAIITPMMKMVPTMTSRCLSIGHIVNEVEIESAGNAEKPATRRPKKKQLINR